MTAKHFKAIVRNTFCVVTFVAFLSFFFTSVLARTNIAAMSSILQISVGIIWIAGTLIFISGCVVFWHLVFVLSRLMAKNLPIQPTAPGSKITSTFGTWLAEIDVDSIST
jgi:hypothetical protein